MTGGEDSTAAPGSSAGLDPGSGTCSDGRGDWASPLRARERLVLDSQGTSYEIVRALGRGGMAEVYLARRTGPAGFTRDVALKCMLAGLDLDEQTRRAFVYEARLAARLHHPGIAEAYDLAELDGRYYLVLEYVDGVTAREILQAAHRAGRRLSEGLCCHVAASVAEALHHAHGLADDDGQPLGIVHRDIKASNLMIARSGAVKLLDFGVAFARLEGRDRTRTGQQRGTFSYFSPEQAAEEPLDGRSDLFSLGVVLVELFTGKRVFDAGSEVGTLRKIAACDPAAVAAATAELPEELAAICARALARERAERFQDGAELSRALRRYLAGRGEAYWPGDCAAELRELKALDGRGPLEPPTSGAGEPDGFGTPGVSRPVAPPAPRMLGVGTSAAGQHGAAPSPLVRRRAAAAFLAAGLLAAALGGAGWRRWGEKASAPGAPPAEAKALTAGSRRPHVPDPPPPAAVADASRGGAAPVAAMAAPVLRPKAPVARVRAPAHAESLGSPEPGAGRARALEFADRASVADERATLPRGTLVPARLVSALTTGRPGPAQAEVAEEVVAAGAMRVPKGSALTCTARPPRSGRVELACDGIRAGDRVLTFSGVAVGEGQRLGLKSIDDEVAAGTTFVVYVSAPAAVR